MQSKIASTINTLRDAAGWRLRRVFGDRKVDSVMIACARRWRALLKKPVFIGVTGSAGKTTTKELILGMLSHKGRGVGNDGSFNNIDKLAEAILRSFPTHTFFVTELSEHRLNEMDDNLVLVQPSIGIVTTVGDDHSSAEYPREAVVREMGKLIAYLPRTGTAILNADDLNILEMANHCIAKVITYGVSPVADLRAEDISSVWPDRLRMTLLYAGERVQLQTRLCGTHWIPSVLGAVGAGLATGMTLTECAEGLASVEPFDGRMQAVTTPDGVTFIRDDFKAPLWTLDACFEFMKSARSTRKIIVIGDLSDTGPTKGATYAKTAVLAQSIADVTVFIGPWASSTLKTRAPGNQDALHAFSHVRDAAQFINSITRSGDLVLLKGTNRQNHMQRIILARSDQVNCWRDDCRKVFFCNQCSDIGKPSGAPLLLHRSIEQSKQPEGSPAGLFKAMRHEQVIVGLGNPEPQYVGTPHNIGYQVLDHFATSLGLTWTQTPEAWTAKGSSEGQPFYLIKVRTPMNGTGVGLKHLSQAMGFSPEQCILVLDELDFPLGVVRKRMSGGAGGHRGIASILEAFQTDAFRRLKVGVGQTDVKPDRIAYVLTPFDEQFRPALQLAISTAQTRLQEMLRQHGVP